MRDHRAADIVKLGSQEAAFLSKTLSKLYPCYTGSGYVYQDLIGQQAFSGSYRAAGGFYEGEALVSSADQNVWDRCIDSEGHVVYSVKDLMERRRYRFIHEEMEEGRRQVSMYPDGEVLTMGPYGWEQDGGLFGYIDEKGEEIIPPIFTKTLSFDKGRLIASKGILVPHESTENTWLVEHEMWGVVDRDGHEVIPFQYHAIVPLFEGKGFAACIGTEEEGTWFVFDRDGQKLTETTFPYIWPGDNIQSPELLLFRTKEYFDCASRVGIFDLQSQTVLMEPKFIELEWIEHGYLMGTWPDKDPEHGMERQQIIYSSDLTPLFQAEADWIDAIGPDIFLLHDCPDHDRLVDAKGHPIHLPFPLEQLRANKGETDTELFFKQNGKWGRLSSSLEITVPAEYDDLQVLAPGFLLGKKNGPWGVVDVQNHVRIPFLYDKITAETETVWLAETGNQRELYQVKVRS